LILDEVHSREGEAARVLHDDMYFC